MEEVKVDSRVCYCKLKFTISQKACMGQKRNAYKIWVRKPERKIPLGRPWRKWEDFRMDLNQNWVGSCGLNS